MSFILEWYPEFLKDKKDGEVFSFINKAKLMALGIQKAKYVATKIHDLSPESLAELKKLSKEAREKPIIEQIDMDTARKSSDLIMFRNNPGKEGTHPTKVWVGYTFGKNFHIYRPSEIGAASTVGEGADKSEKNREKLFKCDQAWKVNLDPKAVAKRKWKKEHPGYWKQGEEIKGDVTKYKHAKIKETMKDMIDKDAQSLMDKVTEWEDGKNPNLLIYNGDYRQDIINMMNDYLNIIKMGKTPSEFSHFMKMWGKDEDKAKWKKTR